ncbi:hypothetical protein DRJ00_04585 [Candidatus Aerophobetes bacterium]|uniref:Uncharacterized protein n=1 Tax=Aerophobetes bacterium TaxID=2030807 RepID=A0A497E4N4_UNCAE|nr:hypothetical protein [Candidatus Aerophobetes bacterium]RLE09272.1 MAG: hypothetical protein DRJ00_04585 [Candidatus Aerophobetes bacterium]
MELSVSFVVGLILGGILGSAASLLISTVFKSNKKRAIEKESKAERIFNLALQQEDQERKLKLLRKILDKYPKSEWAERSLEEVMKMRKEK